MNVKQVPALVSMILATSCDVAPRRVEIDAVPAPVVDVRPLAAPSLPVNAAFCYATERRLRGDGWRRTALLTAALSCTEPPLSCTLTVAADGEPPTSWVFGGVAAPKSFDAERAGGARRLRLSHLQGSAVDTAAWYTVTLDDAGAVVEWVGAADADGWRARKVACPASP